MKSTFFILVLLLAHFIPNRGACQREADIKFTPLKDTIQSLEPLFAEFSWSNSQRKKIKVPHPVWNGNIQVRRIAPDSTDWIYRDQLSDSGGFGIAGENWGIEMSPGQTSKKYFMINPSFSNIMGRLSDEFLYVGDKILIAFKPGTYECRHAYMPASKFKKEIINTFSFTVADPPANETALYNHLIKNDLANYIYHHRYAPENIPLFEEALLLAPETSSLKPFLHKAVENILRGQILDVSRPIKDEERAAHYGRIGYHLKKAAESKHPYLLQNM